jgi:hypothetical protein
VLRFNPRPGLSTGATGQRPQSGRFRPPPQLARASEGLTGSEIEAVFIESLFDAFDRDTEPTDLDIARVLTEFVPLSKTMAEQINALRTWANGRARFATSPPATSPRLRKLAA